MTKDFKKMVAVPLSLTYRTFIIALFTSLIVLNQNDDNRYYSFVSGQSTACLTTTTAIVVQESLVTDTTIPRVYVLCQNSRFQIAKVNYYNVLQQGLPMLPLRPNVHYKCGDSGRKENNCIFSGGDIYVDGTDFYNVDTPTLDNVILEGITFIAPGKVTAQLAKPGNVLFRDCVFKDQSNSTAAVVADYFDNREPDNQLSVTFQRCEFNNNAYNWQSGQAALVIGNSRQNKLVFNECKFLNNDMTFNNTYASDNSYLIESAGPLDMINNCFESNLIGVAPVAAYDRFLSSGNFGVGSIGIKCPFGADFSDPTRYETFNPLCSNFDITLSACTISATFAPAGSPTSFPSDYPSMTPTTAAPTSSTKFPSSTPSMAPTTPEPTLPLPTFTPSSNPSSVEERSSAMMITNPMCYYTTILFVVIGYHFV